MNLSLNAEPSKQLTTKLDAAKTVSVKSKITARAPLLQDKSLTPQTQNLRSESISKQDASLPVLKGQEQEGSTSGIPMGRAIRIKIRIVVIKIFFSLKQLLRINSLMLASHPIIHSSSHRDKLATFLKRAPTLGQSRNLLIKFSGYSKLVSQEQLGLRWTFLMVKNF